MYRVRWRAAVCAAAAGRLRPGGHGRYGQCARLSVRPFEVRTVVYRGQGVIVYEYNSGWARVVVSDSGVGGWMDARFLRLP